MAYKRATNPTCRLNNSSTSGAQRERTFSMIHFTSWARGLLIVVYCSLSDHMLFLCGGDYSQQCWEYLGNEVHYGTLRAVSLSGLMLHFQIQTLVYGSNKSAPILSVSLWKWDDIKGCRPRVLWPCAEGKIPAMLHKDSLLIGPQEDCLTLRKLNHMAGTLRRVLLQISGWWLLL